VPALRQHDVTITEGTFSVVLTPEHRLIAAIHAPVTPLGALHLVFEVDRGIPADVLRREALAKRGVDPRELAVGGLFDDIGHFVSKAAEGTFNTASKVATTATRPVFNATRDAASHAMKGIAHVTPFLPSHVRNQIASAARVVARARLGDLTAKQFIHTIGQAAKAGVGAARHIGDSLLDGSKLVARVVDLPVHALRKVPGVGDIVTSISPFQKFDHMVSALQRGDFAALKRMVTDDLHTFEGVASLIPGIGTGISSALDAGLAALDGGSPIEIALHAAYGAIPIPPGIRNVTDAVLAAVLELAHGGNVTDVALAAARDRIPSGLPRDVFDTLAHLVIKRVPLRQAAGALASHYVDRYLPHGATHVLDGAASRLRSLAPHLGTLDPKLLDGARHAMGVGGEWSAEELEGLGLPSRTVVVSGDEPIAFTVASKRQEHVGVGGESELDDASTELVARLPHPSEWLSGREHGPHAR